MHPPPEQPTPAGSTLARTAADDPQRLLHELQVHQVELAQQNEELLAARDEAQASLRRYRSLYESAPVGLVTVDRHGLVVDANRRCQALLAPGGAPLQGSLLQRALNPTSQQALLQALSQPLAQTDAGLDLQLPPVGDQPGRVLHADLQADPAGTAHVLVALTDITAELELARQGQARAEAASRSKSDFLAHMSHELRTPLSAVLGFSHLLQRDPAVLASPSAVRRLGQIHVAGQHLLAMIDDLLDVSRLESGELRLFPGAVDLAGVVADSLALCQPLARQLGVVVSVAVPLDGQTVQADRTRLCQVLLNLVSNGIKYNQPHGQVVVELGTDDAHGRLTLDIRDTGRGLAPDQIATLFRPFNRLGAEHAGIEGTGLGLVIARRLTEAMGGSLDVLSVLGNGSVFRLRLPRAEHAGVAAARQTAEATVAMLWPAAAVAPVRHARRANDPPLKVLYVEDNPTNVELMRCLLEPRKSCVLQVVGDGAAATEAMAAWRPQLLLLDLNLPGRLDGFDLLRLLRADPATQGLHCVAVSANAMVREIKRAHAAGFDDYIVKPYTADRLLAVVARYGG